MKQNLKIISLHEFTNDDHPFGNVQGKEVFRKLSDYVDANPLINIFGISLKGIVATDASFPRESVVALAKQYRGEKGFYLLNLYDRDLIDNWKYAALAKEQPLVIWADNKFEIIGPDISTSNLELVHYILENQSVTTAEVAEALNITTQNASTKLKKLVNQGYIMRLEEVAKSGGIEYTYHSINKSA